ncbi:MAG: hypothetical protein HKN12_06795 [Gemmatimonadetes bacterium]|nr:hypothetical protein [Gemmatimonadota bacterium]
MAGSRKLHRHPVPAKLFSFRGVVLGTAMAAVCLGAVGCRDDIAGPTLGRIAVELEGAANVEVYLNGELLGVDFSGLLDPLEPGSYTVSAVRECFETLPAREITVEVTRGGIAEARFLVEAREFGSAAVSAVDELTGGAVTGAAVWVETTPGTFVDSGLQTPAVLNRLGCGPTRFVLKRPGYEDSDPIPAQIDTGLETAVSAEMGPARAVMVEMTTYTICPNCPPSVDRLEELQEQYEERFYYIEWHTNGGFGGVLPFYDDRWLERERYYTGVVTQGWPRLIVMGDGANLLEGSQTATLEAYNTQVAAALAACGKDCPAALRTSGTVTPSGAEIDILMRWRSGADPGNLMLRVALLEESICAPGNDPPYHAVPRDFQEIPVSFPTSDVVGTTFSFPVDPSWLQERLGWVAWLQSDATKEILAVHGHQEAFDVICP